MRILFATPYYFPELKFGGPPQKMHAFSRGLAQRGHEVQVVTFHSEQPRACRVELMDGVRVQYLPWFGRRLRQCPRNLRLLAEAVRWAELVHGYGLYDLIGPAAAHYARRHSRPYVLEPLGMYVPRARNLFAKRL
ncbi:MAG: glycosyltransferase [Verrucomicrobia bacterium]|nr:glycosyltransferase [Verrucomicrobiota bacterium]